MFVQVTNDLQACSRSPENGPQALPLHFICLSSALWASDWKGSVTIAREGLPRMI